MLEFRDQKEFKTFLKDKAEELRQEQKNPDDYTIGYNTDRFTISYRRNLIATVQASFYVGGRVRVLVEDPASKGKGGINIQTIWGNTSFGAWGAEAQNFVNTYVKRLGVVEARIVNPFGDSCYWYGFQVHPSVRKLDDWCRNMSWSAEHFKDYADSSLINVSKKVKLRVNHNQLPGYFGAIEPLEVRIVTPVSLSETSDGVDELLEDLTRAKHWARLLEKGLSETEEGVE